VQRQLRESKLKSQGTGSSAEIEVPTGWREDGALFAVNYLAVEYYAAKWLWSGRVMWDPVVSRIPRPGGFTKWGLPRSVDTGPRCRVGFALCVQFGQVTLRRETRVTAGVVVSVGYCLAVGFICKVAMRLLGLAKTGLRWRIGSASIDQFRLENLRWGARTTAGAGAAVTACICPP